MFEMLKRDDPREVMHDGISVIICTHNGAKRLPLTLAHLASQRVPAGVPWEVILMDNASTDGTAEVARASWPQPAPVELRVILEPRLGKMFAFQRGCIEARYAVMAFLDDDNWPEPDWLGNAHQIMADFPNVGACGGLTEGVFEAEPPAWFTGQASNYAVGEQWSEPGDITWARGYLWGAGMIVRRQAWRQLVEQGFRLYLTCRKGKELSSGGDSEVCGALCLAGWQLRYDPRLRMKHYIPVGRFDPDYLRRLHRGFGVSRPVIEAYRMASVPEASIPRGRYLKQPWQREVVSVIKKLIRLRREAIRILFCRKTPVTDRVLEVETLIGVLHELLKLRGERDALAGRLRSAPWNRTVARRVAESTRPQ
jgi:glycosyltransferase involved in cell wall biosynthesis